MSQIVFTSSDDQEIVFPSKDLDKYPKSFLSRVADDSIQLPYTSDQLDIIKAFYSDDLWPYDVTWDTRFFFNGKPLIEQASSLGLPASPVEEGVLFIGNDDIPIGFSQSLLLKYPDSYLSVYGTRWANQTARVHPDFDSNLLSKIRDFYIEDAWPDTIHVWGQTLKINGIPMIDEITDFLLLPDAPIYDTVMDEEEIDYGSPTAEFYPEYEESEYVSSDTELESELEYDDLEYMYSIKYEE